MLETMAGWIEHYSYLTWRPKLRLGKSLWFYMMMWVYVLVGVRNHRRLEAACFFLIINNQFH